MGKRGPPPTPKALLQTRGSWRGSDVVVPETILPPIIPDPPEWLKGEGLKHWEGVLPLLIISRVMRQTDVPALARYCQLWARWRAAEEFLDKYGTCREIKHEVTDENGIPELDEDGNVAFEMVAAEEFPQVKTALRCAESLTRLEDRFGLSPAARTRVAPEQEPAPKKTGKGRFFEKK